MSASPKLQKWLNRVSGDLTQDGPVVRYELWHSVEGEESDKIEGWHVGEETTALLLGELISDAAETDAETRMGNPQRYVVFSFRQNTGDSHDSQCPFIVRTNQRRIGEDSEPGTERGINTQVLRHSENIHRLMLTANEAMLGRLEREVERERERRQKAEGTLWDMYDKYQEVQNQESERRIRENQAKRKDEFINVLITMLPALAAKFMGHNVPPQLAGISEDPRITAVKQFFGTLSEEEVLALMQGLPPEKRINMIQLYEAFEKKQQASTEEKPDDKVLQ